MHVCVNTSLKWIRDTDLSHLRFVNLYNLPSLRFRYFSSYLFFLFEGHSLYSLLHVQACNDIIIECLINCG